AAATARAPDARTVCAVLFRIACVPRSDRLSNDRITRRRKRRVRLIRTRASSRPLGRSGLREAAAEVRVDPARGLLTDALDARELLDARLLDRAQRAEVGEQRLPSRRADARDVLEHGAEPLAAQRAAVVRDREAMRLVAETRE